MHIYPNADPKSYMTNIQIHIITWYHTYMFTCIDHYCALLLFNVQIGEKIRLLTPSATHGLWDRSCPTRQKETGWSAGVRGFDPSPKAPMLSICMNLLYHHISSIFISIQSNESRAKEINSQRTQTTDTFKTCFSCRFPASRTFLLLAAVLCGSVQAWIMTMIIVMVMMTIDGIGGTLLFRHTHLDHNYIYIHIYIYIHFL